LRRTAARRQASGTGRPGSRPQACQYTQPAGTSTVQPDLKAARISAQIRSRGTTKLQVSASSAPVLADPANVRSSTQRRGSTSKACGLRLAMMQMVIFKVAAQAVSVPV
jgi:hypothetical protein